MVLIDGKKFACGACVKGHRSTSCTHTNRSLIEIGKKGRPPTQCAHCRELRRTSKVHSKCMCGEKPAKRTRHLTVLPNGISTLSVSTPPAHPDAGRPASFELVDQILNPCACARGGACCCASTGPPGAAASKSHQPLDSPPAPGPSRPACCADRAPPPPSLAPPPPAEPPPLGLLSHDQRPPSSTTLDPQPTLFAPQTAGTALCFCGIHCPCPGCVLHDPLGLKFTQTTLPSTACPTRIRIGEGCLGGLDLPTVNGLMSLSPISGSFGGSGVQLPGVSETFGGGCSGGGASGSRVTGDVGVEERGGWAATNGGGGRNGCCDSGNHANQNHDGMGLVG